MKCVAIQVFVYVKKLRHVKILLFYLIVLLYTIKIPLVFGVYLNLKYKIKSFYYFIFFKYELHHFEFFFHNHK